MSDPGPWWWALYISHIVFAVLLIIMSRIHRGYALRQSCLWAAVAYLVGLLVHAPLLPHWAAHWLFYVASDVALALWIARLGGPQGAVWVLIVSAALGLANGMGLAESVLYDRFEPLSLTLNLAQVYYLALAPRLRPRDRRATDRWPVA